MRSERILTKPSLEQQTARREQTEPDENKQPQHPGIDLTAGAAAVASVLQPRCVYVGHPD